MQQPLSPDKFAKKYKHLLFRSALMFDFFENQLYEIQLNYCLNPLCKWFGMPQHDYINIKFKPSRYKVQGAYNKSLECNDIPDGDNKEIVLGNITDIISNWSVSEEIKRLKFINRLIDAEEIYSFHRGTCTCQNKTPFEDKMFFHKRGESTGKSTKWQCKECKKITNVLPDYKNNFTYKQKKDEILPKLANLLLSRTPVSNTSKILNISNETYYHKLEILYKKALEFLDRHETQVFKNKKFSHISINSDQLIYALNNIRRRGQAKLQGKNKYKNQEEKRMMTSIIASSDTNSRYVFRCDLAYDFTITQEQIDEDTKYNHDDHAYTYQRQHDRLRFPYAPQPPTPNDTQTVAEYEIELASFNRRKQYVEGCHVSATYTAIAHFWLLKQMLKATSWTFISDEDGTLINGVMRIFADEIKNRNADYLVCRQDKTLNKKESYKLCYKKRNELLKWAKSNNISTLTSSLDEIAFEKLFSELQHFDFYEYKTVNNKKYPIKSVNMIEHPLPAIDEGIRYVRPITSVSHLDDYDITKMIIDANNRSINTFFNMIHRKLSILERPLVTSRGEGKSYIYSNYNPKYAHYVLTILRTIYNFCWDFEDYDKSKSLTPAQRLGLTDKKFNIEDIIYFH